MRTLLATWLTLAIAATLGACGGGANDDATADGAAAMARAGFGSSTAAPAGKAYRLPAGVTLAQPIAGFEHDCERPLQQVDPVHLGRGAAVRLCLALTNHAASPVRLTLPEGLTFVSLDVGVSNGVLAVPATVELPPAATTVVNVYALCLNEQRRPTRDAADLYVIGPVSEGAQVPQLMAAARDTAGQGPLGVLDDRTLQKALWRFTERPEGAAGAARDFKAGY